MNFKLTILVIFGFVAITVFSVALNKTIPGGDNVSISIKNNLQYSNSPYLLQHADNPVNWQMWGETAFERAKKEKKLIFLSIGYSTCHWCHVMEHESFEDEEVAKYLNDNFISIKVDREERPDIDKVYMNVCQAMTGGGGWPMTIITTPDKLPIFAGTYFPKNSRFGRPGLLDVLKMVENKWKENPSEIMNHAVKIKDILTKQQQDQHEESISPPDIEKAALNISANFDSEYGGFGSAPKFPMGHELIFLLRIANRTKSKTLLDQIEFTLKAMYQGGIFDHVGYGFSRYSTDAKWLVPHFEKMLYDNALLAMAYTEAWQITRKPFYKKVVNEIFEYIKRDMTSEEGAFFCAENADSEGEEGKFYVFTKEEFLKAADKEHFELLCKYFGVTESGNFEKNTNVLHFPIDDKAFFKNNKLDKKHFLEIAEETREKLFKLRAKRIRPSLDDKILVSWNALMISALAQAGYAFGDSKYISAAKKAADFILTKMRDPEGRLFRSYRKGKTTSEAFLSDYSFLSSALIDLYESTYELKYLKEAIKLQDYSLEHFSAKEKGVYYETGKDAEKLFMRPKNDYDGAMPSSLSALAMNSVLLGRLTGKTEYEDIANDIFNNQAFHLKKYPAGFSRLLTAYDTASNGGYEIVFTGKSIKGIQPLQDELKKYYLPGSERLFVSDNNRAEIESIISYAKNFPENSDNALLYLCKGFECQKPISKPDEIKNAVSGKPE